MTAVTQSNWESSKRFRRVKIQEALEAIRHYTLKRTGELYSEMEEEIREKTKALEDISSRIRTMDPKVGQILSLEQFVEYVRLQTQRVVKLKELPVVKEEVLEELHSMLEDSVKLFVPARMCRFATEPLRAAESLALFEEVETQHCRYIYKELCLEAIRRYALEKVDALCSAMKESKEAIADAISKIEGLDPRLGKVLTTAQFEEYVALQKLVVTEANRIRCLDAMVRQEFESMLRDGQKMYIPSGKHHKFVTEPLHDTDKAKEVSLHQECPMVYKIASYIFLLLTFIASVIVFH